MSFPRRPPLRPTPDLTRGAPADWRLAAAGPRRARRTWCTRPGVSENFALDGHEDELGGGSRRRGSAGGELRKRLAALAGQRGAVPRILEQFVVASGKSTFASTNVTGARPGPARPRAVDDRPGPPDDGHPLVACSGSSQQCAATVSAARLAGEVRPAARARIAQAPPSTGQ